MVRHIVLFGFYEHVEALFVEQVIGDFIDLAKSVDAVNTIEYGKDVSSEGLQQGHTHAFLLSFATIVQRDAYLVHPLHLSFIDKIEPFVNKTTVLDYIPEHIN